MSSWPVMKVDCMFAMLRGKNLQEKLFISVLKLEVQFDFKILDTVSM